MTRSLIRFVGLCRFVSVAIVSLYLHACSEPAPLDTLERGETGRVVRVIDGDALVLSTGLSVRLVGIEAPAPERRNRVGEPYADQSRRLLEDLAMGRDVSLIYPGITRDRYDRALAYVETTDNLGPKLWLNLEMIRNGGARARIYPDTSALGDLLMEAEKTARNDLKGLWALADYKIKDASSITQDDRGFYLIRGTIGPLTVSPDDRAACARKVIGADLQLSILSAAARLCSPDLDITNMVARGYVRDGRMEITHTLNIEPVQP